MKRSLERVSEETAKIIPVLLKNYDWRAWKVLPDKVKDIKETELKEQKGVVGTYQFFPMDEDQRLKPVNRWEYEEDVWTQLTDYIRKMP